MDKFLLWLASLFSAFKKDTTGVINLSVVLMIGIAFAALMVISFIIFTIQDSLITPTTSATVNNTLANITAGFDNAIANKRGKNIFVVLPVLLVKLLLVAITIFIRKIREFFNSTIPEVIGVMYLGTFTFTQLRKRCSSFQRRKVTIFIISNITPLYSLGLLSSSFFLFFYFFGVKLFSCLLSGFIQKLIYSWNIHISCWKIHKPLRKDFCNSKTTFDATKWFLDLQKSFKLLFVSDYHASLVVGCNWF